MSNESQRLALLCGSRRGHWRSRISCRVRYSHPIEANHEARRGALRRSGPTEASIKASSSRPRCAPTARRPFRSRPGERRRTDAGPTRANQARRTWATFGAASGAWRGLDAILRSSQWPPQDVSDAYAQDFVRAPSLGSPPSAAAIEDANRHRAVRIDRAWNTQRCRDGPRPSA